MFFNKFLRLVALLMSMTVMLSSFCSCSKKVPVIKDSVSKELQSLAVFDLDEAAMDGRYKATETESAYLATMKKLLSNKYLELYIGKGYDIAVLDKETGSIHFSNPGMFDSNISESVNDSAKAAAYSQIFLTYYDSSNNQKTMSSYPDSISDKNDKVNVNVENNTVEVTYEFGDNQEDMLVCHAFTEKSFDALKKQSQTLIDDGKLDEIAFIRFTEAYSRIVYDELGTTTKNEYEKRFPLFKKLGALYVLREEISQAQINNIIEVSKVLGIDKEYLRQEEINYGGGKGNQLSSPYFKIPLVYTLQDRDVVVSIDASKIKCADEYYLTKISVLSNFGATKFGENGYTFVPDGSGAIISNDIDSPNISNMDFPFYGSDFGKELVNSKKISSYSPFPIFGVYNGSKAIFGIVESGDALGGITTQIPTSELPYNTVSPWFNYYIQDYQNAYAIKDSDNNTEDMSATSYVYMKTTPTCTYSIRYHFLYGEHADYSGMATYYQSYLIKKGVLKDNLKRQNLLVDLNIIGAITKKTFRMGIPIESVVAASDFDATLHLTERLEKEGVENLNVIYRGCFNGGLDFQIPTKLKVEKVLGGENGYIALYKKLATKNQNLLPMIDFSRVYEKGNGLNKNSQISRYINQKVAYYSEYAPSDLSRDSERISYILNPLSYSDIVDKFVKNDVIENKSIFASTIASYLSGNYDDKYQIDREEAKLLTRKALEKLNEAGYSLTFDGCNEYALEYADSISEIPVVNSNLNIESYSIPFVGMVLHGYIPYSGSQLNQSSNYKKALLQTIENGAGLNYILMTENTMILQDTAYSDYYSIVADEWENEIIDSYKKLNSIFKDLTDCTIVKHTKIADGVFCVLYSNGTKIYVNYNQSSVETIDGTVESLGYMVVND